MRLFSFFVTALVLIPNASAAVEGHTRVKFGPFDSRAIIREPSGTGKHPIVIMLPGAGPSGPESIALAEKTADGKVHPLFNQLAEPLVLAGAITIQVGKPGVEFYSPNGVQFYNKRMYVETQWTHMIANVSAAVEMALQVRDADPSQIYILGHSEGAQLAVDYAAIDARIKGLILLGYTGLDPYTLLEWQMFIRPFELFVVPDVDKNRDKWVSKDEIEPWKEALKWKFNHGQTRVPISAMQDALRADPETRAAFKRWTDAPIYQQILRRGPIFEKTAQLKQDVIVFTGELDVQTHPREAQEVAQQCRKAKKKNCAVVIVPGLGHGFSAPKAPRAHKYLDATLGPVAPEFQNTLFNFAKQLFD